MYVVVSGAGEVGYHVAKSLREEGHGVAIIEKDPKVLKRAEDLDALVLQGNGASLDKLLEADLPHADLFIGATGDDEVNMLGAAIAKSYGVGTIARINSEAYLDEPASNKYRKIGIDVAVCPELVAAMKIARILTMPSLVNVDVFSQGRVAVVEARVQEASLAVGKPLSDVQMPPEVNLLAVFREEEILIPRPQDILRPGDRVLLAVLHPDTMGEIERVIGLPKSLVGEKEIKKVVIAGATRIGIHLARLLEDTKEVVVIDEREDRCNEATERLTKSLVLNANATDRSILVGEDVGSADAFIGAHPVEEYNILACLIGKSLGVRKTIALINQPELADMVEDIGIDLAVGPRLATVGAILKWTHQVETLDVVVTHAGDAQILEVKVTEESKVANKPLRKAHLPDGCVAAAVVRGDKVLLPKGDDPLLPGDDLVLFALTDTIPRLKKLF